MSQLLVVAFLIFAVWAIRRDTASRDGISAATWIPTLWLGIIASRPVSMWLGTGGGIDTLDGSPVDRLFYLSMIIMGSMVLMRRNVNWQQLVANNWPIAVFYGFLLVSVLWANSPAASAKRWIKEFGNIVVVLVILSEINPQQAIRAVFFRCAIVLIPLSIIFLRYFPELGRRYLRGGGLEVIGVTTQKNSLGVMVLVCGLVLIWDWVERKRAGVSPRNWLDRYFHPVLIAIGCYLLWLCDSKTSMLCFVVGGLIIASIRLPLFRERFNALSRYALVVGASLYLLEWQFGISADLLELMGRDATFTGRTDVWRVLRELGTNPLHGTGFMSFWDDPYFQSQLPYWVAFSAHNGYLEVYLAGGYLGIAALIVMILGVSSKINRGLRDGSSYSVFRFAVLLAMIIGNFAESNFACMTPLGFLFLIAAFGTIPQSNDWMHRNETEIPHYTPGPEPAQTI